MRVSNSAAPAFVPGRYHEPLPGEELTLGHSGPQVVELQKKLNAMGAKPPLVVDGKLGSTSLRGRSQSSLRGGDLLVALEAEFTNPDGGRLAGQISGTAMPASALPGRLVLKAEGNPRRAVSGTVTGALAGVDLGFDGSLNPFRATPLEGRFTLAAADLAVPGGLLGGHPGLFPHGVPGRAQLSAATWEFVQGQFEADDRGEIDVKGKGRMRTFLLKGRKAAQRAAAEETRVPSAG